MKSFHLQVSFKAIKRKTFALVVVDGRPVRGYALHTHCCPNAHSLAHTRAHTKPTNAELSTGWTALEARE